MEPRSPKTRALGRQQYRSLADIAYFSLLEAIINQQFQPGASVSIDGLARELSMSNTPIREALMRAQGERLVTQESNRGFVVADILTPRELHELFDVRHLLETHALEQATITPDAVASIQGLVEQMVGSSDGTVFVDFRDYMALDHQFHRALVELAGNRFLLDSWNDLHVHLHLSRLFTGIGLFDRSDSTREHKGILEALEAGDKPSAVSQLSAHIIGVEARMQAFLVQ